MFEGDRKCQFGHSNRLYCHNTGFILPAPVLQGITLFGWWKDGIKCDAS